MKGGNFGGGGGGGGGGGRNSGGPYGGKSITSLGRPVSERVFLRGWQC